MSMGASKTDPQANPEFLLLHRSELRTDLFAAVSLVIFLGILRIDALLSLSTHVMGGVEGDAGLYLWLARSNARDLFQLPWFTTQAFFPYTGTLAWSDNYILPSTVIALLQLLGLGFIASTNITLFTAQLLNGVCTYSLTRRLTGHGLISTYAGLAFMSWPYLAEHLGHPQLQFAFWLPLSLIPLLEFIAKPALRPAAFWGLAVTGAFLCTVYYAVFAVLLTAVTLMLFVLARPSVIKRKDSILWCTGAALGLLPVVPFLVPYLGTLATFNERQLHEPYYFAANVLSYLSSATFNLVYGFSHEWSHAEARLFPGITVFMLFSIGMYRLTDARQLRSLRNCTLLSLLLALLCTEPHLDSYLWSLLAALASWGALITYGIFTWRLAKMEAKLGFQFVTNRTLLGVCGGLALFFVLFSLGPLGKSWQGEWALGVYRPFYEFFPGVSAARALGRIGVVVMLAVVLGSALGLKFLVEQKRIHPFIVLLAFPATLLESLVVRYPLEALPLPPSAYQFLAATPKSNDALLVLPLTDSLLPDGSVESWGNFARRNVQAMLWGQEFQGNLVNGYSGQRSWIMKNLPRELRTFPSDAAFRAIARIAGLKYILVATGDADAETRAALTRSYEMFRPALNLIFGDESGNLLFEFTPLVRADRDFTLLAPTAGPRYLELTLFANYQPTEMPIQLDILLPDYEQRVIASTILKTDRQEATLYVKIPDGLKAVTPVKIGFRAQGDYPVYLRRTRLLDEPPAVPGA